ncbi:MAG: hypothetical protein ACI8ZF_000840 [Candidatus Midichloriaceae bacterium]|jgi:hypothetical protein
MTIDSLVFAVRNMFGMVPSGVILKGMGVVSINIINSKSGDVLKDLLDSSKNPIACKDYGKSHCDDEARNQKKIDLWGKRGDEANGNECKLAFSIYYDDENIGFFNIGVTGNTVKDFSSISFPSIVDKIGYHIPYLKKSFESDVYESSGVFISDKFIENDFKYIGAEVKEHMIKCVAETGYTKLIATFNMDHPYQDAFWKSVGAKEVTADNVEQVLGTPSLSMHPARFRFEDEKLQECVAWDKGDKVSFGSGWHDSNECTQWIEKKMFVLDINDEHIAISHDDM